MQKNRLFTLLGLLAILLAGCNSGPDAETLMGMYQGTYCSSGYKLELRGDGTYVNSRITKGFLSGRPVLDKCTGTFEFVYDDAGKSWSMKLQSDGKNPNPMVNCGATIEIWKKETGFVQDTARIVLKEVIDGVEVAQDQCESI